jgi:hypothetical protein
MEAKDERKDGRGKKLQRPASIKYGSGRRLGDGTD